MKQLLKLAGDMSTRLILASRSPRRRELLAKLRVPFEVFEPRGIDEAAAAGPATQRCATLALRKAESALEKFPGSREDLTVIGCDTLVSLGTRDCQEVLGKPFDRKDATRMLSALSGHVHRVVTGVAVVQPGSGSKTAVEVSEVRFRNLSSTEIESYVATGNADDKAGAYAIQSLGARLAEGFQGCYYNVVGLPLVLLARMLPEELAIQWACDCQHHALQLGVAGCSGSPIDNR